MSLNQSQLRRLRFLVVLEVNNVLQWISVADEDQLPALRANVDDLEAILRDLDTRYHTIKELELWLKKQL